MLPRLYAGNERCALLRSPLERLPQSPNTTCFALALLQLGATPKRPPPQSRSTGLREPRGPAGPGVEVLLAVFRGCGGVTAMARAALDHAMTFAEAPIVAEPESGPAPPATVVAAAETKRLAAWRAVLQAGVDFANAVAAVSSDASVSASTSASSGKSSSSSAAGAGAGAGSSEQAASAGAGASATGASGGEGAGKYLRDPAEVVTGVYLTAALQAAVAFRCAAEAGGFASSLSTARPPTRRSIAAAVSIETLLSRFPLPATLPAQRLARAREQFWSEAEAARFLTGLERHGRVFARVSASLAPQPPTAPAPVAASSTAGVTASAATSVLAVSRAQNPPRNTQQCVAYYYCLWRRTQLSADYKRRRENADKTRRMEREMMRRDRAWFHMWRFDEDALGPPALPAAVPLPPLLRVGVPKGVRLLQDGSVFVPRTQTAKPATAGNLAPSPSRGAGAGAGAAAADGAASSSAAMSEDFIEIFSSTGSDADTASADGALSVGPDAAGSRSAHVALVAADRYLLPLVAPSIDAVVDARGRFHEALAGRSHGAPAPTGTGAGTGSTASAGAGTSNGSAAATATPGPGGAPVHSTAAPVLPTTRNAAQKAAAVAELVASNPPLPFPIGGNLTYVGAVHGAADGAAPAKMSLAQAILSGAPVSAVAAMASVGLIASAVPVTPTEMKDLHDAQSVDPLVDYARAIATAGDIFASAFAAGGIGSSAAGGSSNGSSYGLGFGGSSGAAAGAGAGSFRSMPPISTALQGPGAALVPASAECGALITGGRLSSRHAAGATTLDEDGEPVGTAPHMLSDSWVADRFVDNEAFCYVCGDGGDLLCCDGPCRRSVHKDCLRGADAPIKAALRASPALISIKNVAGLPDLERDDWRCAGCVLGTFDCFICGLPGQEGVDLHRCARMCGKVYHLACLAGDPRTRFLPANRCSGAVSAPLLEVLANDVADAMKVDAGPGGSNADAGAVAAVAQNTGALRIVRAHGDSAAEAEAAEAASSSSAAAGAAAASDNTAVAAALAASAAASSIKGGAAVRPLRIAAKAAAAAAAIAAGLLPGVTTRFVCPFHLCANPACSQLFDPFHPPIYYRCHACPTAYHATVSCATVASVRLHCRDAARISTLRAAPTRLLPPIYPSALRAPTATPCPCCSACPPTPSGTWRRC